MSRRAETTLLSHRHPATKPLAPPPARHRALMQPPTPPSCQHRTGAQPLAPPSGHHRALMQPPTPLSGQNTPFQLFSTRQRRHRLQRRRTTNRHRRHWLQNPPMSHYQRCHRLQIPPVARHPKHHLIPPRTKMTPTTPLPTLLQLLATPKGDIEPIELGNKARRTSYATYTQRHAAQRTHPPPARHHNRSKQPNEDNTHPPPAISD